MMSARSAVPSVAQQEKLLECFEEEPWLATGYARTSHARDRTRAAWQEIAITLNSDGGCIKSRDKWAKNTQSMAVEPGTSAAAASPLIEEDTSIPTEPTGNIELPTRDLQLLHVVGVVRARRGLLRRSPPSMRQSQLASLSERFIAIEEKRVETEQTLAQNQRELINVLCHMSEAWSRQSQALQDLINRIAHKYCFILSPPTIFQSDLNN